MSYLTATWILTTKNFRLLWRRPISIVAVGLAVIASILIIFALQRSFETGDVMFKSALRTTNPVPYSLDRIPRCIPATYPDCITLAYVPSGNKIVKRWIDMVANQNGIPVATETRGFPSSKELNQFLVKYPNRTQAAYIFERFAFDRIHHKDITFIVQYNASKQIVFPGAKIHFNDHVVVPSMIHAMNKVLIPEIAGVKVNIYLKASKFPHPLLPSGENAFIQSGSFLIFGIYFLIIVIFLTKMTEEKEQGIREAMRIAGMSQSQHFISWGIPLFVLLSAVTLTLVGLGNAFQFKLFLRSDFSVQFLTFFSLSMAFFGWTFLLTPFLNQTRIVSSVSFLLFTLKAVVASMISVIYVDLPNGKSLIAENALYWREIMATLPGTMFVHSMAGLALSTKRGYHITFTNSAVIPPSYSIRTCWLWMLGSGAVAFVLGIYLDNVLPTPHGSPLHPLYFLFPSYWRSVMCFPKRSAKSTADPFSDELSRPPQMATDYSDICESDSLEEDVSVYHERNCVTSGERDSYALVIKNIVRRFSKFTAVDDVSISVPQNSVFACLGHNGAGKSTLFKMLTTSIGISSGDAFIQGQSVQHNPMEARRLLGVCHQHDALWDLLSAAEHIDLFAALKGLSRIERKVEILERLRDVGLEAFSKRLSGAFSGGMRRRLSVAISLTGNPQIVLLDEFTTGADPLVRRDLWAAIERAKKGRAIFVVTHSMAEAERLGDNIGIMANGRLRVLGTALSLKTKFGAGYRITVKFSLPSAGLLESKLKEACPGITMIGTTKLETGPESLLAQYALPKNSTDEDVLNSSRVLEARKDELGIVEFGLRSTSLEQVFKSVSALTYDTIPDETKSQKQEFLVQQTGYPRHGLSFRRSSSVRRKPFRRWHYLNFGNKNN